MASTGPAVSITARRAWAVSVKPWTTSRWWHVMDAGLERGRQRRCQSGAVGDDDAGSYVSPRKLGRRRFVEDGTEPGVGGAVAHLVGLGPAEGAGDDRLEHPGERRHLVGAHHLEQARFVDDRDLRAAREEHLAAAPCESVSDEVRSDRPQVLGPQHGAQREPSTPEVRRSRRARSRAAATIRVAAMGDMALIVTPGGGFRPSCHVSAAMARLAQL